LYNHRFPVLVQKYPVLEQKFPVLESIKRIPVTQDGMAAYLGCGLPCLTPAQKLYKDYLHKSIEKLVYCMAHKYVGNCHQTDLNDLVQDCWYRILVKLHTFDPTKGRFTTWCWRVCSNVLNKKYRKEKKRSERYVDMPDGLEEDRVSKCEVEDSMLAKDIKQAILDLIEKHPTEEKIIIALLGSPDMDGFSSGVNLREASEKCNEEVSKVSKVYNKIVRPFFKKRFSN
jgi:RNA polymerase sigma factor (sigma-70 family)